MFWLKNISQKELSNLILKITSKTLEINEQKYGNNIVAPNTIVQMSVYSTLKVLEELELLTLPKKE